VHGRLQRITNVINVVGAADDDDIIPAVAMTLDLLVRLQKDGDDDDIEQQ
jgi:hypothetical protein